MVSSAYPVVARDWQPDRRTSLLLALVSTLLALCGFMLLLRSLSLPDARPDTISIRLLDSALARLKPPRIRTNRVHANRATARHLLGPRPSSEQRQQTLDLGIPAPRPDQALFPMPQAAPLDRNLQHMLDAPRKPVPVLQDGQAHRGEYGETMIKSGNQCGSVHTIQMSPSPTNKATIGFLTDCPGEYQPTMGQQLLEWAGKHAKAIKPPP